MLREQASFPDSEQILYEYDRESDGARKLLDWVDSGFQSSMVDSVAGVSSEKLLVAYSSASRGGLYQLTRTPVEELPEKELLVIVSANPDMGLQDAVLEFNRDSSRYRITIDSYGAYYSDEENKWMMPGLDPALASSNSPDLVDMKDINISGYAQRDSGHGRKQRKDCRRKAGFGKNSLLISLDWSGLDLYALER